MDIIDSRHSPEKIAIITIDDGWRMNLKLLNIIEKLNVYVTLFVTTSAIEQGNFWFEYVEKYSKRNGISSTQEKIRIKQLDKFPFVLKFNSIGVDSDISRLTSNKNNSLISISKLLCKFAMVIDKNTLNGLSKIRP